MSTQAVAAPKLYPYRFAILILVSLMNACLQFAVLVVPGMGGALRADPYLIPAVAFTAVAAMPYLTGFVFGISAGALADKTSIRLVLIIGICIALVGAVLRIFFTSFIMLIVAAFLLGCGMAALNATSAKIMRLWFPSKSTSIAMGIYVCAATVGAAFGIGFGPVIAVPTGFLISVIVIAVAVVTWLLFGRKHPDGEGVQAQAAAAAAAGKPEGFMKHLAVVAKSKNAWVVSFTMFFLYGCTISIQTFAPQGYAALTGSAAGAGTLAFFNTVIMGVGGILLPIFLSRMSKLKPMFVAAGILNAAVLMMILHIPQDMIWIAYAIITFEGMLYGILIPMGKTLPALIPDVKVSHIGVAGGMQSMFQNLGAFLIPVAVIAPICTLLAGDNTALIPIYVFTAAGISSIICGLTVLFIPETGTSVAARMQREAEAAAAAAEEK